MKNVSKLKFSCIVLVFFQFLAFSQDNRIKIYESKSGDGSCVIVFPNSPDPLMVMTSGSECTILKTMAHDDWHEMSAKTVVTTELINQNRKVKEIAVSETVKSPRDAASGLATGKRQHKPILLSSLTLDALNSDSDGDSVESASKIYSFSWGMSNSGGSSMSSGSTGKATYNVKSMEKARTVSPSGGGCCSNGVCTVTVSVDKKHTKSGHVTLLK